ncbi:MAG: OsmC family protein [Solirubrobacterales bacterium]
MTIVATARRRDGHVHDVEVSGHKFVVDEPESAGGTNLGPSPTRLLAASLASCTALTIEMYTDRKGWDLGDQFEVSAEFERGPRGECDHFAVTMMLPHGLSDDQMERIRKIAGKCPVHRTLASEARIEIEDRVEVRA